MGTTQRTGTKAWLPSVPCGIHSGNTMTKTQSFFQNFCPLFPKCAGVISSVFWTAIKSVVVINYVRSTHLLEDLSLTHSSVTYTILISIFYLNNSQFSCFHHHHPYVLVVFKNLHHRSHKALPCDNRDTPSWRWWWQHVLRHHRCYSDINISLYQRAKKK